MSDAIKRKHDIPDNHTLEEVSMEWKGVRKGRDDDIYHYVQKDEDGNVVANYEEVHSTSTYPPFATTITVKKI